MAPPSAPYSTLRPLSIGEILDGAFTIYRRHFRAFFLTELIFMAPAMLIAAGGFDPQSARTSLLIASFLSGIFGYANMGAVIWQSSVAALGGTPSIGPGLKKGLRNFLPLVGASVGYVFLIMFGFLLLGIGAILAAIMLFATFQVVVLESNWGGCLGRSRALARGSWKKIFAVMLVAFVIAFLPAAVLQVPEAINNFRIEEHQEPIFSRRLSPVLFWLQILVQCLTVPFSISVQTLLYYDQRVRKEGLDVELAASALDGFAAAPPAVGS